VIIPTPHQQGVDGHEATTGPAYWSWARLLGRVFALDMVTCPFGRQGALRMIAAITQAEVSRTRLCHLKRTADPPPIAAARACQATFDWVVYAQPSHVVSGATCAQRWGVSPPLSVAIPFALAPCRLPTSPVPRPSPQGTPIAATLSVFCRAPDSLSQVSWVAVCTAEAMNLDVDTCWCYTTVRNGRNGGAWDGPGMTSILLEDG
jgi:hypothetical protein